MRKLILLCALLVMVVPLGAQQKKQTTTTTKKPAVTKPLSAATVSHNVVLTWVASTVPPGAPAVNGYNIYRGATSGGETLLASAGNVTTYTDSTVVANTTYFYVVTATSTAGESGKSNEVTATIPNVVPPNPPTGLTVTSFQ